MVNTKSKEGIHIPSLQTDLERSNSARLPQFSETRIYAILCYTNNSSFPSLFGISCRHSLPHPIKSAHFNRIPAFPRGHLGFAARNRKGPSHDLSRRPVGNLSAQTGTLETNTSSNIANDTKRAICSIEITTGIPPFPGIFVPTVTPHHHLEMQDFPNVCAVRMRAFAAHYQVKPTCWHPHELEEIRARAPSVSRDKRTCR